MSWRCDRCDGELFSFSSLRSNHLQIADAVVAAPRLPSTALNRNCPFCRDPMQQVQAGSPPPIPLEVCDRCRAIWFDDAEYHRVFPFPVGRPRGAPSPVRAPPNFRAWFTYVLLLLMVGISLWAMIDHPEWIRAWGFIAADPWRAYGATMLTAFFLHANLAHLIGNALVFWSFGEDCEEVLGRFSFVLLVASATIAGCVAHAVIDPRPDVPCIGASGGIAGVLAYYCARFPHRDVVVYMWFGMLLYSLPMSAITWLVVWLLFQIAGAALEYHAGSFIAYGAHVGGACMGLIFYLFHRLLKPMSDAQRHAAWWKR